MTAPTGIFANDKNIHVIDSDDDSDGDFDDVSDGPDEVDTGYIDKPCLHVHPRFSAELSTDAGAYYGSVVLAQPFTGTALFLADCADVIESQHLIQSSPADTDRSDVSWTTAQALFT
ncbi:hypothetical protein CYMTET_42711 [Cymbomonas tetramitiformis]|uniref:Uncharacterized protein n=1 Tax=Cymbomonas tetramitiformis TaxID=36881 RepID=A0AAE0C3M6_9CHLO|nr:hypothetical protein CYMTET_42711 [Cymbomonas tetramitiformis]